MIRFSDIFLLSLQTKFRIVLKPSLIPCGLGGLVITEAKQLNLNTNTKINNNAK